MTRAGTPTPRHFGLQPTELRPEKRAEIIRMLHSKFTPPVIAKRAGVSRSSVLKVAAREGIVYARGKPGRPSSYSGGRAKRRLPSAPAARTTPTPATPEANWCGRAASLRWGSALGGGWRW